MQVPLHVVLLLIFTLRGQFADEIWEQDLSMDMQIGASTKGYDLVALRCGAEKMVVDLQTSENFSGVIYTRGSFYSREPSCFLNPDHGGNFTMSIPFNQCGTENVDNKYRNTLVLQHDDELITPGDAAFILECDFSKPRDLIVSAGLPGTDKKEVRSSISLVDADPGRDKTKRSGYVENDTNEVVFVPNSVIKINDEL
ncbi:uncharacterized protein LOC122576711 [Bombus pyrosoma]|uniref:uncharacterized protein LOC122576711 n=1 Tax=Bombus pyrosoma TaxID=396416 RepID=UPI001CB98E45|nr:uncharacterized protein LOC122576711 [Bombus pyrosoma]